MCTEMAGKLYLMNNTCNQKGSYGRVREVVVRGLGVHKGALVHRLSDQHRIEKNSEPLL